MLGFFDTKHKPRFKKGNAGVDVFLDLMLMHFHRFPKQNDQPQKNTNKNKGRISLYTISFAQLGPFVALLDPTGPTCV